MPSSPLSILVDQLVLRLSQFPGTLFYRAALLIYPFQTGNIGTGLLVLMLLDEIFLIHRCG